MQAIALPAFLLLILWLISQDIRKRPGLSAALWLPFFWVVIVASRPVSSWFQVGVVETAAGYNEGNPFERNVYVIFLILGLITLARRGVRLSEVIRQNGWLSVFTIYWLCSVLWAELPFVAFKRWSKDTGNILMVLVILTEHEPVQAAKAVFVRSAFLLIPCSFLFIRYYPEFGRAYDPSGGAMFTGVATHKNTLGALALICSLFLIWQFLDRRGAVRSSDRSLWLVDAPMLGVALWLVLKSNSATSQACVAIGAGSLWALSRPAIRARINQLEIYTITIVVLFWLLNSVFDLYRLVVVDILGRDLTLTTRTDVWPILLSHADGMLLGSGFMSFWSGGRMELLYEQFGIIQAHNGYLQLYLNGGFIAIFLFVILVLVSIKKLKQDASRGDNFAIMKLTFLIVCLFHNLSEASISSGGLMWFTFLFAIIRYEMDVKSQANITKYGGTTLTEEQNA